MTQAFFGPPEPSFVPGGTHLSVYLVPVFEGHLVVFDVRAPAAHSRWLPWDVLPWKGNPYATASALVDDWCEGAVSDLRLVDALSLPADGGGWELALVFRATLTAIPPGDQHRQPRLCEGNPPPLIHQFAVVDLARWVQEPTARTGPHRRPGGELVF